MPLELKFTLNTDALMEAVNSALVRAVKQESAYMENDARRFAPVRKVFSEAKMKQLGTRTRTRRHIVPLTAAQLSAEMDIRQQLGLGPGKVNTSGPTGYRRVDRRTLASEMLDESWYESLSPQKQRSTRSGPQLRKLSKMDIRRVNDFGKMEVAGAGFFLSARGRYELAHARERGALSYTDRSGRASERGTRRLGGRLRSEITQQQVTVDGHRVTGGILSPTPYAKYVEFGTHHAPAQPFLRPTATIARRRFPKTLQRELDGIRRSKRRGW